MRYLLSGNVTHELGRYIDGELWLGKYAMPASQAQGYAAGACPTWSTSHTISLICIRSAHIPKSSEYTVSSFAHGISTDVRYPMLRALRLCSNNTGGLLFQVTTTTAFAGLSTVGTTTTTNCTARRLRSLKSLLTSKDVWVRSGFAKSVGYLLHGK